MQKDILRTGPPWTVGQRVGTATEVNPMERARRKAACCRSIYLTILSVATLGCICALFAGTLVLFAQYSIFQYAAHAASILVGCLIVSGVLLLFAIYVSVH